MRLPRAVFFPLLLAFVLLFAQQAGAAHAIQHAVANLTQQEDKQVPYSDACEKCADYTQLGNALSADAYDYAPSPEPESAIQSVVAVIHPISILAAAARGPPQTLQTIA